ncbi:MAG: YXWGXW repeat-containing protein [Acidobacteriaceae bacterium]
MRVLDTLQRQTGKKVLRALVLAFLAAALPVQSFAGIFVSVGIAPPPLPVYTQPMCPGYGYMWTPGRWGYGEAGYFWVPGVWVRPPAVGLLWTPGYWGYGGGLYAWHAGYWGPHVGFYGGINYGFGYGGVGFGGGYWRGGNFFYNRAVMNVNTTIIHNTYNRTVINRTVVNDRTSFNGGVGGVRAMPTAAEMQAAREQHFQATQSQMAHLQAASASRAQLYSANRGQPAVMAKSSVYGRSYNQQGRIVQGLRSGQLRPGQAARALNRQQNIRQSVRADRRANGGRLTPQQRRNIDRRQNNASRQIYRMRHNNNGRGPRG